MPLLIGVTVIDHSKMAVYSCRALLSLGFRYALLVGIMFISHDNLKFYYTSLLIVVVARDTHISALYCIMSSDRTFLKIISNFL